MRYLTIGSLALAAVSLLALPRGVAYDPWSWLIWGREIGHLALNTRQAATAVKPLPMFLDTVFAVGGSLAPVLWLLVARAAALLSLVLAFRLGRRLGGAGAGLLAAIGLAVSNQYVGNLFMQGMSEPMATAAVLAAVDSHLRQNRRAALGFLIAAGLLRPEAWPFLFAYCLWLAYRTSLWRRAAALTLSVAVPAVWFILDWFGSRQFSRSAGAAQHESQGGPLLKRNPGLATIQETWHLMSGPVVVLFVLAFVAVLVAWVRDRRAGPPLWIGLGALGWLVVDALLAQGRFATGAPRYLLPGVALACVLAGVFVADAVRALTRRLPSPRAAAVAATLAVAAVASCFVPRLDATVRQVSSGVRIDRQLAGLENSLDDAIALAGGRDALLQCGRITTQPFRVPLVAWKVRVPLSHVFIVASARGTVLQQGGVPTIPPGLARDYRIVGVVGPADARWTVLSTCAGPAAGG